MIIVMAIASLLALCSCRAAVSTRSVPVVVAAYPDPQQQMLAALSIVLLRAEGFSIVERTRLQGEWHVRQALEAGSVHLAWQDSGTVWFTYLGHDQPVSSETSLFRNIKAEDYTHDIIWLTPLPWSNRQSIVIRADRAAASRLSSIADLAQHISRVDPQMTICIPQPLATGTRGIAGLQRVYGFSFQPDNIREMASADALAAVLDGTCDCTVGSVKDLALYQGQMVILRDSSAFFPASSLAPTLHVTAINQYPELERILGGLTDALDQKTLAGLEREAVQGRQTYLRVAERYLATIGLID
jgi:osmoprotectant transport system substrate-binding protein